MYVREKGPHLFRPRSFPPKVSNDLIPGGLCFSECQRRMWTQCRDSDLGLVTEPVPGIYCEKDRYLMLGIPGVHCEHENGSFAGDNP